LVLNQRASEQQIETEKQWLIEQELSAPMCEEFKRKVVKAWRTSASVGTVIELLGNSVDLESNGKCKKVKYLGINIFCDKAAFVEGWHVDYPTLGETVGKSLANGENSLLLKEICSSLRSHKKSMINEICASLLSAIMDLRKSQFKPNVIFIRHWDALTYLRKSERFKRERKEPSSEIEVAGCRGYFEDIPIFLLDECPTDCCIIDVAELGVLNRCRLNSGSQPYLKISITQIDDEMAEKVIAKNPKLLKDEESRERTPEAAKLDLRQKVILKALEKVRFEVQDRNAGLRLEFAD